MNTLIRLADAVTSHLNGGAFSRPLQAVRRYQPVFELPDLQELQVSVVPKSIAVLAGDRSTQVFEAVVDVGIQKQVAPEALAELDALLALVGEVLDALRGQRLPEFPEAAWVGITNEPVFAPEHLQQKRVFTSVVSVTYRLRR